MTTIIETIALNNGLTANISYDLWADDPLQQDYYFEPFAINAWDKRCNRQDSDFCSSAKPDISGVFYPLCDLAFLRYLSVQDILNNIGKAEIVCYALFWQHSKGYREFLTNHQHEALMRAYRRLQEDYYFDALGLYEHSGYSFYTGTRRGWDNSSIGFVSVERKFHNDEAPYDDKKCESLIKTALEAYNAYANGQIMIVDIENQNGEIISSCSGFYDDKAILWWLDENYGLIKETA